MKRIILALMLVILSVSSSFSEQIYPSLGMSNGDYVRLREKPDTNSEILGRIYDYQPVIVFGERNVKGEKWYEIDHPTEDKTAWVFGKYISLYEASTNRHTLSDIVLNIRIDFGLTPEKARILLGKPKHDRKDKFFFEPAQKELNNEVLEYSGCLLSYIENELRRVEITGNDFTFDSLAVGVTREEVISLLGKADDMSDEIMRYDVSDFESLGFDFSGNRIIKMTWERALD